MIGGDQSCIIYRVMNALRSRRNNAHLVFLLSGLNRIKVLATPQLQRTRRVWRPVTVVSLTFGAASSGQLVKYMRSSKLKFGFMSTYESTVFIRRTAPYRFEMLLPIGKDASNPSLRTTADVRNMMSLTGLGQAHYLMADTVKLRYLCSPPDEHSFTFTWHAVW